MVRDCGGVVLSMLTAALLFGMAGRSAAQGSQTFSEAKIFLELNDTDGDLGLHSSIDGGPWTNLEIEGPKGDLLSMTIEGPLQKQGMTQLFFESAEPSFDELDPAVFFRRFPEGRYEIEALGQDGGRLRSRPLLSHVLAAPPQNILVSGVPAAESCDATPLPKVSAPVVITWDPVTQSHPEIGKSGPVKVARYQFFVERENVKLSLDLPPTVTEVEIPAGVTALGTDFKFEIIVTTDAGNNTAVESCFELQ
jgi:hypothetical protein